MPTYLQIATRGATRFVYSISQPPIMTNPLEFLAPELATDTATNSGDGRERAELLVAKRGGCLFGVFAKDSDGIVNWKAPTPLPGAAAAIQGLICVRGRMFTVIDPALLGTGNAPAQANRFVILLNGAEQLALGVERVTSISEIYLDEIYVDEIDSDQHRPGPMIGRWTDGAQDVVILDPHCLFVAASTMPS